MESIDTVGLHIYHQPSNPLMMMGMLRLCE
jgi:hypothetical protein